MEFEMLSPQEQWSLRLRRLYGEAGFTPYRVSRFEEYGLYRENRRFLGSDQVITFTDLDGRLLALKPDVTLSIAKNAPVEPGGCGRFYYLENVYRPSRESGTFREIRQMGLECIGTVNRDVTARTVRLAAESLGASGRPWALEVGHMGFVTGLFDAMGASESQRRRLLPHIRDRSLHELLSIAVQEGLALEPLAVLCGLSGNGGPVLEQAEALVRNDAMASALLELRELAHYLTEYGDNLRLDLSLVNDLEYYNGLVLRGFLEGVPRPALRGGRYDPLADKFRPGAKAVGFAVYLDELERLPSAPEWPEAVINVALPKGRLGDKVYNLLDSVGYGCPDDYHDSRKLVVENAAAGIRYFLVKPGDVAAYVEHGAADVGIVGRDVLEETGADVYELLDTGLGKCRMCVAAPEGFTDDPERILRVATKFVNITRDYYAARGREIDIIKLHGSIELAPLLGLSDVIVDIVETGTTLKENRLRVLTEFLPVSARLIANRSSYQFKRQAIAALVEKLRGVTET